MDEGSSPVVQEQQVTPDPRPQEPHVYPDRSRQAPVRYGIDEYVSIATSDDQLSDNVNYRIEGGQHCCYPSRCQCSAAEG